MCRGRHEFTRVKKKKKRTVLHKERLASKRLVRVPNVGFRHRA